ncbi:MAG TPA: 3-isopropylmalate dehydratase small subunit [Steroidobacteraceae bacterium]|jgi:3-isopropylmalate/(R)-2-methylmalate dehydratase small subunit
MDKITTIRSRTVVLPASNIDTDQIIPARFLTTTTRFGLGKQLFADWRYAPDGSPRAEFILNQPQATGCQVLVAGRNFGCGSSREHAPWALLDYGFRAVISTEIADIFRNNSLKNGLLPIVVDDTTSRWLIENPASQISIDLASATLRLPNGLSVNFPIDPFARYCLLNGVDELGFLLQQQDHIAAYEQRHKDN